MTDGTKIATVEEDECIRKYGPWENVRLEIVDAPSKNRVGKLLWQRIQRNQLCAVHPVPVKG